MESAKLGVSELSQQPLLPASRVQKQQQNKRDETAALGNDWLRGEIGGGGGFHTSEPWRRGCLGAVVSRHQAAAKEPEKTLTQKGPSGDVQLTHTA